LIDDKRAWVERVLGVVFASKTAAAPSPAAKAALMPFWRDAKEAVDGQITALTTAFRGSNHPLATAIADQGLSALGDRIFVGFIASLFDYDGATPATRTSARKAVEVRTAELREKLAEGGLLALLERNPYGVNVTMRAEIARALDRIDAILVS